MKGIKQPLTLASLVLASAGFILSAYLTYVHYNIDALVCSGGGCEVVQLSEYSEVAGVPIAIFGLLMFAALIAGIILREIQPAHADLIGTGMIVVLITAVLYWMYLTYLELYVIYAVCQWCVATSIVTAILLGVEGFRWYQGYKALGE